MRFLKVAGAALNQTPMDWRGNRENIIAAIELAQSQGVQLLCLPELAVSGYGCEDAFHGKSIAAQSLRSLFEILPKTKGMVVTVGLPLFHQDKLYNTAALMVDGVLAGFAAKRYLAGDGVYYEPRWFTPWPAGVMDTVEVAGKSLPIGHGVFDLSGVKLGFEICEDAWRRDLAGEDFSLWQADVLLNPSASHFAMGKYEVVRDIVEKGSQASHGIYLYSNLLGNESGRLVFDGTVMVASQGQVVQESERFSFGKINFVSTVVDLEVGRQAREEKHQQNGGRQLKPVVPVAYGFSEHIASKTVSGSDAAASPRNAALPKNIEFARAVSLGLWDYLRKSRSQGLIVSLSGGVDSTSVAVLVWVMVKAALAELGVKGVREQLAHIKDLPQEQDAGEDLDSISKTFVQRLLTTVYQATTNSSQITRQAARQVAEQVGARHLELEIGDLVAGYEKLAEQAIGRDLTWERDDVALQNIQARVRSPGIWLLANLEGRLLLSTSNRSEIGVGYATMDGDTSGGLAPIAGANKTFLRSWLKWMETEGLPDLGPLPALTAVNVQAPTAELRPLDQNQTDEADLMPYPVLDAIEQAAIRDRMTPIEVWEKICQVKPGGISLDADQAAKYVDRFFRLWAATQWKRERLAPSFHLDDENLDPRTWCRFPILSGGYEEELEALRQKVAERE